MKRHFIAIAAVVVAVLVIGGGYYFLSSRSSSSPGGSSGGSGGGGGGGGGSSAAPTVASTSPAPSAIGVGVNSVILATFSEAMDPTTISSSSFTVAQGSTSVSGIVTYSGTVAAFAPNVALAVGTSYTATITTTAQAASGSALGANFVWAFTTGASAGACGQLLVNLGSAAPFAVLAGSTVTNTGPTALTGDLGVSPGSAVTGFPPGTLTGTKQLANSTSAAAMSSLTTAYNDAAGRTLCPVSLSGNLGGLTLTPGLYKSTSGLAVSSGTLTLNAQGNASAVFIFQISTTLVISAGLKVILTGGAVASHVFWQVGSSASLGTNCVLIGVVMANQAISLATGATLNGQALARIGGVSMESNTVTGA